MTISLAMFNQLIGINASLYYLNDIFATAGFDRTLQNLQGGVVLVVTLIALSLIDRLDRRTRLFMGLVGVAM